jgi:hypothetical protein
VASQPLAAVASQSPKPALHIATVHAPAAHPAVAFATVHVRPHAPQLATSVAVATSQPLAAIESQSPKPALHVAPHTPAAHAGAALGRVAHAVPQALQFSGSVWVFVHRSPHATDGAVHVSPRSIGTSRAASSVGGGAASTSLSAVVMDDPHAATETPTVSAPRRPVHPR